MLNVHLLPSLHIHHSCPTQLDNLYLYITKSWSVALIFVTLLLNHISSHVIYLIFIFSFLYLNFSSQYLKKKKTKKKSLLFPISSHTYCYISSNLSFSFLPSYLPTTLLLYFLPHFLYFDFSFTYFILYKIDIFFLFNPYFLSHIN